MMSPNNNGAATVVNEVIRKRRSIYPKQYEPGKAVPNEVIWQILENASYAPTHKKTEPWRFTVFSGAGLQRFAELQAGVYKQQAGNNFKEATYQKLLDNPLQASHIIAIGMKRNEEGKLPEVEEVAAVACAVQNIYLSVTAYGLGGYWTTGGITYYETAKQHFGLGEADKLLGFFYIGYPAEPVTDITKRQPIAEKVTWVEE